MQITTHSDEETKNFGKKIALDLKGGDVVCLYGELGAGKTTLVKGIAEGLGIKEEITSPTFTLMNVYRVKTTDHSLQTTANPSNNAVVRSPSTVDRLVHIDTYRLKNQQELLAIGAEDYLGQPGIVTIVEWPEKIENLLLGKKLVKIALEHGEKDERKIEMTNNE